MLKGKIISISLAIGLAFSMASPIQAATFSQGETTQVHTWQKEYANLNKTHYNPNNLYSQKPVLGNGFSAGELSNGYIDTQLNYINYYRSLFGLAPIITTRTANENAQKAAAVMAAINANPFVNQHGLPSETRPSYIDKEVWKLAQDVTETSNLNFNVNNESAGDVITDLLTDQYNLSGSDTGHRAWILSTRLSSTGIGAVYGSNGYRYSVQKVLNISDLFRAPSQEVVAYPNTGVFPIEITKGPNIAWSLYLSSRSYTNKPKIRITDRDSGKSYQAENVKNYSSSGYGNFKTIITYSPGATPLIAGHAYSVDIKGIYSYSFKLFNLVSPSSQSVKLRRKKAKTYQKVSRQKELKSAFSSQGAKLWAIINPTPNENDDQYYFDSLKKGQWKHTEFIRSLVIELA